MKPTSRCSGCTTTQREFTPSNPGWVDERGIYRAPAVVWTRREGLTCYMCYAKHHLAVECTLPARELERLISNCEALTKAERGWVPGTMYWKAESFVAYDMKPSDKIPAAQYAEAHAVIQVRGSAAGISAMNQPNSSGN